MIISIITIDIVAYATNCIDSQAREQVRKEVIRRFIRTIGLWMVWIFVVINLLFLLQLGYLDIFIIHFSFCSFAMRGNAWGWNCIEILIESYCSCIC